MKKNIFEIWGISPEKFAKMIGAKRVPMLREIIESGNDYIKVGNPILFIPTLRLGNNIPYLACRYASHSHLKIEDIVAYSKVDDENIRELEEKFGNGYGIQFYTNKEKSKDVSKNYHESEIRVYQV